MVTGTSRLDDAVLGRILLLQSGVHAAPDAERLAGLLAHGLLRALPGVIGCRVSMADGQWLAGAGDADGDVTKRYALRTASEVHGEIELICDDLEAFVPYEPYVGNTVNLVALHLQSQGRANRIETLNRSLEGQVAARTAELEASNASLRESRLAALNMMEDAVLTAQRLEITQHALDTSSSAVVWYNEQGRIAYANAACQSLTGYSQEELLGLQLAEIIPTYDATDWDQLREAGGYVDEVEALKANGGTVTLEVNVSYVEWDGQGYGFATGHDISERRRAQEALRVSEMQQQVILDATPDLIGYLDPELNVIWANRAACHALGNSTEEIKARPCYTLWGQRDSPCEECPLVLARETKVAQEGEIETPDGRTWLVQGIPVMDEQGEVVSLVEYTHETTSERLLEEELWQAQKMEAVGRLAGGVAHDFNNMLSVIMGHSDLALQTIEDSDPLREDLLEIRKASERSANLTRQLLAFARRQTVVLEVLDLNETVSGMLIMLRRLIGEEIDLVWEPHASLWSVKMDPSQVDQILANLCVNARDAIEGIGTLRISTDNATVGRDQTALHPDWAQGEYVMLSVRDSGCGMDADVLEHIFEPFFTTKPVGEGTGLGLATIYGIVRQSEGIIDVESEPGEGTVFRILLPRYARPGEVERSEPKDDVEGGQETVLLVEDEPAILRITEMMLLREGYTVLAAGTPSQAITLAQSHRGRIDLLMTDVIMPEMNGRDLARAILRIHPNLKRLFFSGYTDDVIADHGVLAQDVAFLAKPFSRDALCRAVRASLDGN